MKPFATVALGCTLLNVALNAADDPLAVLAKCRELILSRDDRLPNYTCNETVDRFYYARANPRPGEVPCNQMRAEKLVLTATDRIRLEVKISEGKEIGSFPGAGQFESRSIFELVGGGTFGTGPLGALLVDIFGNVGATVTFQREEDKLIAYHFSVPLESSHYHVQAWGNWKPVAYEGSAWIDPTTSDITRIQLRTAELPPETHSCYSTSEVDYNRVRLGSVDFLAPSHSTLSFMMRDATKNETSTTYSQCRQYQVESTLRFDEGPFFAAAALPVQPSVSLPAGLEIPITFTAPIDSQTAAAGDMLQGRTRKAVVNPRDGQLLIPAGAIVEARLTTLRFARVSPAYVLFAISLQRVQIGSTWSPIFAKLSDKDQMENSYRMTFGHGSITLPSGSDPNTAALPKNFLIFPASKNGHVIPRGFQTTWVTTAPPAR